MKIAPFVAFLLPSACTFSFDKDNSDTDSRSTPTLPSTVTVEDVDAVATSFSAATLTATLSHPAMVAAACVRDDDSTEIHLVEGAGETTIVLRLDGLLHGTAYTCSVAPISPPGDAVTVDLDMPDPVGELASADAIADPSAEMTGSYTVMNVRPECFDDTAPSNYLTVLDPEGNNRWRYDLPSGMNIGVEVVLDGPNRFLWGGGRDNVGAPAIVDVFEGEVWKLEDSGPEATIYHHDVNRIDDGRILAVEESDAPGWDAFQLRLVDEAGETSWFWDVQEAVATGWIRSGSADVPDPHHLNWADVVQTDDGLVAYGSLCYDYAIIAIDVASSLPLWRFGIGGDFALVDESGAALPDDAFPQCQHGLQMDGTNLMVYDNGLSRGETRVVEYALDFDARTATRTWEWKDEGFWEKYHGGTDWLTPDHNRVLITEGNNDCGGVSARPSQVVELDRAAGDLEVHRLVMRDVGHWLYRAHRIDGCDLFANTKYCPALAERFQVLRPALGL